MRIGLLLSLVSLLLLSQTSCGVLSRQATNAKHILQWPFRAELDSRFLQKPCSEMEREEADSPVA